jgi:hypothetical protein
VGDGTAGSGNGGDAGDGGVDGSESSDSDATSWGDSSGSDGWHVLAWLDAQGVLELRLANQSAPTCDDPHARPDYDPFTCDLEHDLWFISLYLEPPFMVPGDYETAEPDPHGSGAPLSAAFSLTLAGDCSHGTIAGVQATLTLDAMTQEHVAGTADLEDERVPAVPFDVAFCR